VLALIDKETLDKQQVATVFTDLQRRPVRPSWTGSPNRSPSTVPPVEIPAKVRAAASNGAHPAEDEGAIVITPPGAGGDLHGGSEPGGTPPTPPSFS
jgi:cell division protease FtsH